MGTQLGTPWRGAAGPLHSGGCSGDGHHRSLWHLRVIGNSPLTAKASKLHQDADFV